MNQNNEPSLDAQGLRLIEQQNYHAAVTVLKTEVENRPDGRSNALLGLAFFQLEDYEEAARQYRLALAFDPDNSEWRAMLDLSDVNRHAEVNVPVPDVHYFDRETLLAGPNVPAGSLPARPAPAPAPPLLTRLRIVLGNGLGAVSSALMTAVTQIWGNTVGYRDRVWTNWYRRPTLLGILTLSYMRWDPLESTCRHASLSIL